MKPKDNASGTAVAANRDQSGALGANGFAINPIEACANGSMELVPLEG
jgi:hypothetical protein